MNTWRSGVRGRSLAVLAGLSIVCLVWFAAVSPMLDWFAERQARIAQHQQVLLRAQALVASIPMLRAAAEARSDAGSAQPMLLSGASDAVAAAGLQDQIQALAVTAGATLTAVETMPVAVKDNWHKVSLRITCVAPWPVLMGLIAGFERGPTRMFVDEVHFHSNAIVSRAANLPIQASLVVYGFRPGERRTGA